MSQIAAHATYKHLIKISGIMPSNRAVWLAESRLIGKNLNLQYFINSIEIFALI